MRGRAGAYLRVFIFRAPDVGAGADAVVGEVALGLVDPFPAQVVAEVDVELAHAAAVTCTAGNTEQERTEVR